MCKKEIIELLTDLGLVALVAMIVKLFTDIVIFGTIAELFGLNKLCLWLSQQIKKIFSKLISMTIFLLKYFFDIVNGILFNPITFLILIVSIITRSDCFQTIVSQIRIFNYNHYILGFFLVLFFVLSIKLVCMGFFILSVGLFSNQIKAKDKINTKIEDVILATSGILAGISFVVNVIGKITYFAFCSNTIFLNLYYGSAQLMLMFLMIVSIYIYKTDHANQYKKLMTKV